MVAIAAAKRPFGRIRLSVRPKVPVLSQSQTRPLSSTVCRNGVLGPERSQPRNMDLPVRSRRPKIFRPEGEVRPQIHIHPPLPSTREHCREALKTFQQNQVQSLDPTGARQRLFATTNPEAAKLGDILLVRQRNGDPFAGVCLSIRRRGVDTAILLRNHMTRVGVEMWYKIFSPNVEGIEIVQRREKRARRARLFYMRQEKHDRGSLQNIVDAYLRQRQAVRGSQARGRDANANRRQHTKSK